MATFIPRTSTPGALDAYWRHTSKGGKNECILISGDSCLPNCVGYAWGRAYEILGTKPKLSKGNAENWFLNTSDGYKRGNTPAVGAIICWSKGVAGDASDGAGHVAVVEEVKSNGDVVTSNSAYNGTKFYMKTITKSSGYSMGSSYKFQGFIYLLNNGTPSTTSTTTKTESKKEEFKPYMVKVTANELNIRKGPGTSYAIVGSIKDKGTYTIVDEAMNGSTKWGKLKSGIGYISIGYTSFVKYV